MKPWAHPGTINTDEAPAYRSALAELKAEGKCLPDIVHRQVKYLNNIVEADHGKLKRLINPARGLKWMKTAYATIKGFELMRMFKIKGGFMEITIPKLMTSMKVILIVAAVWLAAPLAKADTWRGTAPFCDGQCLPNEREVQRSECGDGGCCWTGSKALCANLEPTCTSAQTNVSCYGVVQVCDNGYYSAPDNVWHSCSTYACGVCFGFDWPIATKPLSQ